MGGEGDWGEDGDSGILRMKSDSNRDLDSLTLCACCQSV